MSGQAFLLLWSDRFPQHPTYSKSEDQNRAFGASAAAVCEYILNAGVVPENIQLIYGAASLTAGEPPGLSAASKVSDRIQRATSNDDVISLAVDFVTRLMNRPQERRPADLVVYFVGHGIQTPNDSHRLVFSFSKLDSDATTLSTFELFSKIRAAAWSHGDLRIIGILDACYSGVAATEFEKHTAPVIAQPLRERPQRGLVMLCSAPIGRRSTSHSHSGYTQFTEALLSAVGHFEKAEEAQKSVHLLSLRDLEQRMKRHLAANYLHARFVSPQLRQLLAVDGEFVDLPLLAAQGESPSLAWTPPCLPSRPRRTGVALAAAASCGLAALALMALSGVSWRTPRVPSDSPPADQVSPVAPPIEYRHYEDDLPTVAELSVPPPSPQQFARIRYQICNRSKTRVRLRLVNCTVMARAKLPESVTKNLTMNIQFDLELDREATNDLRHKPFGETSGSGWYLVFAMPAKMAGKNGVQWQFLTPEGRSTPAVQLFQKQNTNLVIRESAPNVFVLEVDQSDTEIDDCKPSGNDKPA